MRTGRSQGDSSPRLSPELAEAKGPEGAGLLGRWEEIGSLLSAVSSVVAELHTVAQRPGWSKPEIESAAEDRRIHSQVPVLVEVVRGVESFWVRGGARGANILGEGKLQGLVLFPLKPRQDLSWEKGRGDGRAKGCRLVCNTGTGPSAPLCVGGEAGVASGGPAASPGFQPALPAPFSQFAFSSCFL